MHLKTIKIEEIENSNDFENLLNIAKERNFLRHLDKYSIHTLNLKKIKNFIIACVEEEQIKTRLKSKPYRVIIEPTNACNLGCQLCPTGLNASDRKKGIMKLEKFKKIIDEVKEYCIEIHLYNWGEPTLNKHLVEMLKYTKANNLWSRISTNLSLDFKENYLEELLKSGLSLIHVDVDGLDQDVYEKYRKKGNFDLVVKNLKKITKIKNDFNLKEPILELAMLSMRQNEHQHDDFFKFGKEFDPDEIKVEKIQHNPNMDTKWLPTNKDHIYSTYEGGNAPSRSAKDYETKPCHWPWSGIVINWDGGVNPCCIIDDPKSDFSNINNETISNIWNSENYVSSRSEFGDKKEIKNNTICNVCKNQTHSKKLNRVSGSFAIKL